uniref:Uncharacterized protein n=1 Tax=Cucumis melo TaxID=3656 RepID=A0A9I9EEJ1_CUCME
MAISSNNARLRDVADDPQQVLHICNNNERYRRRYIICTIYAMYLH